MQLRENVPPWLEGLHLEHGSVRIEATPRRLAVFVEELSPRQPDREDVVKGPPADKAFDPSGVALPAAVGFAKKNSVDTRDLEVREIDGGQYVVAVVRSEGRPAPEVLAESLPELMAGINFTKSMRWLPGSKTGGNESSLTFSRPIRWLVAMLGEQVIPFAYASLVSGDVTRGLRPYDSPDIEIPSAEKYFDVMRESGIVIDNAQRRALIVEQVTKAATSG